MWICSVNIYHAVSRKPGLSLKDSPVRSSRLFLLPRFSEKPPKLLNLEWPPVSGPNERRAVERKWPLRRAHDPKPHCLSFTRASRGLDVATGGCGLWLAAVFPRKYSAACVVKCQFAMQTSPSGDTKHKHLKVRMCTHVLFAAVISGGFR